MFLSNMTRYAEFVNCIVDAAARNGNERIKTGSYSYTDDVATFVSISPRSSDALARAQLFHCDNR